MVVKGLLVLDQTTLVLLNEPLLGLLLGNLVAGTNASSAVLAAGNAHTGASENDVKVHTEDTGGGVVLNTEIDVLIDTETEVTGVREVSLLELVFLNLQATLDDIKSLVAADSHIGRNGFISADGELTNGVAGTTQARALASELLENTRGESQSVSRLTDGDVENELLNADLPHRVAGFGGGNLK